MGFDDPIVFPGQPGKSHLHTFFGNTLTDAFSTVDSIAKTGNSKATSDATASASAIRYKCIHGPNDANYGYINSIPKCKTGEILVQEVFFPQCWDGKNLDSANHMSHMAYPSGGSCPATHPVGVPEITFNIEFLVGANDDLGRWRLSSDNYDKSLPGGFSSHGDWFYGWDPKVADAFTINCNRTKRNCHSHLLGDGRYID